MMERKINGRSSTHTHPTKRKVRLILPGGGVKGTFQVGFIQAMQRSDKYEIDHVYGTSVGALIAPFAVCGRIDRVADHFASLRNINDIVDEWPWYIRMLPTSIRVMFKLGAFRRIKLADQLISLLRDVPANEYSKCSVVAWDLMRKKEKWWSGCSDLATGMKASSNLWLVVPPLKADDTYYVDGGVTELVPTTAVKDDDFEKSGGIYVILYCDPPRGSQPALSKFPGDALRLMHMLHEDAYVQLSKREVALFRDTHKNVIEISPPEDIFEHAMEVHPQKMHKFCQFGQESFTVFARP